MDYRDGRIVGVAVCSSRPLLGYRLLQGKSCHQVLQLIPLLYSVCGTAQTLAALQAIESALAIEVKPEVLLARRLLLKAEVCRELVTGLLRCGWVSPRDNTSIARDILHWFSEVNLQLKDALNLQGAGFTDLCTTAIQAQADRLQSILVMLLGTPLERVADQLQQIQPGAQSRSAIWRPLSDLPSDPWGQWAPVFLPACWRSVELNQLQQQLLSPEGRDFCARPLWQGRPRETGCFSRQAGTEQIGAMKRAGWGELAQRLASQFLELSRIPEQLRSLVQGDYELPQAEVRAGYGMVESARGLLLHRVELKSDQVISYHILAPTEWNFHPRGLLADRLEGVEVTEAKKALELTGALVALVDPCVAYSVELKDRR